MVHDILHGIGHSAWTGVARLCLMIGVCATIITEHANADYIRMDGTGHFLVIVVVIFFL